MKKSILILFLFVFSLNAIAQHTKEHEKKIKGLKIAFITENLDLSNSEAEKFWPIYNSFEEKMTVLKKRSYTTRKELDYDNLNESEAKLIIEESRITNAERNILYDKFITDLLNVISAKKVVLLKKTEDDFRRKMFDEYRNRRKKSPRDDHP